MQTGLREEIGLPPVVGNNCLAITINNDNFSN